MHSPNDLTSDPAVRAYLQAERERVIAEAAAERAAAAPLLNPADDPQASRDLIQSLFSLAATDPDAAMVMSRALMVVLMDLVSERAATDDAFAQRVAGVIVQSQTLPTVAPPRVPRGRQGTR
jgi:hypothetical protein